MTVHEFDTLLESLRYAVPRWSRVFDPENGPYNAVTGDRYEPLTTLILAPYECRAWATNRQLNIERLTVLDDHVETFSVRIDHEQEDKRYIIPYRARTLFPVITTRGPSPYMSFPAEACERALAKYGAVGALKPGYEEYALRALIGHVVDTRVRSGVRRRAFVEELAASFAMHLFGFQYDGIRVDVIANTAPKIRPIELAHDIATATATVSNVAERLGVKRS